MADMTRRVFLKKGAAAGATSAGGIAIGPGLATALFGAAGVTAAELAAHDHGTPLVAYVRDAKAGDLALVVGEREIAVHDPSLVLRLLKAAR